MSVCFLFPGQGSQTPGMLSRLPKHEAVDSVLEQASSILNRDVHELDTDQALKSTAAVQLSLFIAGVAVAQALEAEGVLPAATAGLSIGAFGAAVICNTMTFADGLHVVQERARLMENRYPAGFGMSAIVGLTEKNVAELVRTNYDQSAPVFVSNINDLRQIIISGSNPGLDKVEAAALKAGARKAERLNVAVPSHCPLFQSAADELRNVISKIRLKDPSTTYVGNVRARPLRNAQGVAEDLAANIANGVRWHDSIAVVVELGCSLFIEMNPGNVLSRLGSESFPDVRFIAVEDSTLSYISRTVNSLRSEV